jgi:hypothetical protein
MVSSADELIKMNPIPDTQISFLSFGPAGRAARHMGRPICCCRNSLVQLITWRRLHADRVV